MKRNYLIFIFILFVWGLVACGPSNSVTEEEATAGAPILPQTTDDGMETTVPEQQPEEAYPVEELPLPTAVPDDYPIATIPPPPQNPYPARDAYPAPEGTVWVVRPVGVQCETAEYTDIQDAITDLTALGVEVHDSATFDLPVAAVCGGPTNAHFRVLIDAEDVEAAAALDWQPIGN